MTGTWTYEFDDHAGYDGMTSGHRVYCDGELRLVVDADDMPDCHPDDWDERHRESAAGLALARLICARLGG